MVEMDDLAGKIFALLKGNGLKIKIYDDAGAETTNPNEGRRFFVASPNIMVTIDEDGNQIGFSKGTDVDDSIDALQKNIRKLGDEFLMNSDIKVFGKQIQPRDYAYQAKMKSAPMNESISDFKEGDRVVATIGRFDVISGNVIEVTPHEVHVQAKDGRIYRLDPGQCKVVKKSMNENMPQPHNHHLVGQVLHKVREINHAAAQTIADELGVHLADVQPVLNKLVTDGKIKTEPGANGDHMYSVVIDEAVMESTDNIQVHDLREMDPEDAYAETQTNEDIKDGDVLLVDGGIAIMYKAWPTMVRGNVSGFHKFNDESKISSIDGGKYAASLDKAMSLANKGGSIMESFSKMFGSLKTSQQTLENVRILVKHKVPVDENVRGARARHISAIFLECNGERFRFGHNYLPGARAMAQHMAHGGIPSDKVGGYITESTGNLLKLQSFNRYVTTNKLINEDSSGIVETVKENIETIRTELKKLTGVKTYETVKARLETFEREALAEDDVSGLKDLFTIRRFDEKFEGVLPIIKQMVQEKDTFHKRIEEAAANTVMLRRGSINTTPMFEFASENARLGFKLNELALRILENEELAGFVNKIGIKLCKEGVVNDFEKAVLKQVLENFQIAETQVRKEIKESSDLSAYYDRFDRNFY